MSGLISPNETAAGSAASGAGLTPIAGSDGTTIRAVKVDATGAIVTSGNSTVSGSVTVTNFPATQPVSGSVSLTGTLPAYAATPGVNPDSVVDGVVTTANATSATTVVSLPMAGYQGATFQITSIGSGNTVTFEGSNDNSAWVSAIATNLSSLLSTPSQLATATGAYAVSAPFAYLRARVSTYGSGTVTISAVQKRATQANIGTTLAIGSASATLGNVGVAYSATNFGGSIFAFQSLAATTAVALKASAGKVTAYQLQNSAATARSIKFFNVAQGSVTMGTTSALFEIDIPAGGSVQLAIEGGIYFSTAITYAVTSAKGLTDNTSTGLAANDVSGFVFYV